ncbi:MAG: ribose-phosphate pyrophosphokinase [Ignavibacteriales bacterium]|nr:ribose-phosphate pyrophosphokinase [Ignavibacteriales bacterium]
MAELKLFSGRSNPNFAEKVSDVIGIPLGKVEIQNFSDGEIWVKYNENIRGTNVFIVQSTNPPAENLIELLILIDAAKRASARRITAVIPYFGYARQDRKDQPRVSITAKLIANLVTEAGADRVIAMDLHAPQIQGFFDIPVDHLYSSAVYTSYFAKKNIPDLTVVSPDVGGIKMARAFAKRLNAELILIDKRRPKPNEVEVMNVIGNAKDRNILIVDDLIDTAGTFTNAVRALRNAGAKKIYGACTHPIFSGESLARIRESDVEKIYVTDSIPLNEPAAKFEKIEILSVTELFGEAIKRGYSNQSISSLFDVDKG